MNTLKWICKTFLLTAGLTGIAQADFYAVNWSGTAGAPATSSLVIIKPGGVVTTIGDTGLVRLNSLAVTASGDLATISSLTGIAYTINKLTGAPTFVFDQIGMPSDDVRALAINSSGWYVINDGLPDLLYRIDPGSGIATLVGSTGVTGIQALAFHPTTGELYAVSIGSGGAFSKLGTVSTTTGVFSPIGAGNSTAADSQSLAFDNSGTLFGLEINEIYTWNLTTGDATIFETASWGIDVRGAEFLDEAAKVVPSAYSIVEGVPFGGSLASLMSSDDDPLYILSDETAPNATLEVSGSGATQPSSSAKIKYETAATRTDLSVFMDTYVYGSTNAFVNRNFSTSTLSDNVIEYSLTGSGLSGFVGSSGEVSMRLRWIPQSDVEAADGWSETVDQVSWTLD